MTETVPVCSVIVGVTPHQAEVVIIEAAALADRVNASLICVHVDGSRYTTEILPDSSFYTAPIGTDLDVEEERDFDTTMMEWVRETLERSGRRETDHRALEFRELVGDPALAMAELADQSNCAYFVVGTRRNGLRAGMKEFFGGSVAAHLTHRQSRPVLVVPVAPTGQGQPLPWEPSSGSGQV